MIPRASTAWIYIALVALALSCGDDDPQRRPPKRASSRPAMSALPAEAPPVVLPDEAATLIPLVTEAMAGRLEPMAMGLPAGALGRLGSTALVHPGLETLSLAPGGKLLITSGGGETRLWDTETGRLLAPPLTAHRLVVADDGKRAAAMWPEQPDRTEPYHYRVVSQWDPVAATSLRAERLGSRPDVFEFVGDSLAIDTHRRTTADGRFTVGRGERSWLVVRDGAELVARCFLGSDPPFAAHSVAISPDGRRVAYSDDQEGATLFELVRGECKVDRYLGQSGGTRSSGRYPAALAFSADGELLVVSGRDFPVTVFPLSQPRRLELPDTAPAGSVLAVSADRALFATASRDGRVRLWADDQIAARAVWHRDHRFDNFTQPPEPVILPPELVALAPRSSSSGANCAITAVTFVAGGQQIVTGGDDGLRVWDARSLAELRRIPVAGPLALSAALGGDAVLVVEREFGRTRLFDPRTGEPITQVEEDLASVGGKQAREARQRVLRHTETRSHARRSVWLSADATAAAVAGTWFPKGQKHEVLELWDAVTPQLRWRLDRGVTAAAFAHTKPKLAVGTPDGRIMVLDLDHGGATVRDVAAHQAAVTALAYSPDDSRLVSGSADTSAVIWDVARLVGGASDLHQ